MKSNLEAIKELGLTFKNRKSKTVNKEEWKLCAKYGLLGDVMPEEYGGAGLNIQEYSEKLRIFAKSSGDAGLVIGIGAHVLACQTMLLKYGTEEQKKNLLPGMCNGDIIASIAISEAGGASEISRLKTTATFAVDSSIKISGEKQYITNLSIADIVFLFCGYETEDGNTRLTCVIIDKSRKEVSVKKYEDQLGLSSANIGSLQIDNYQASLSDVIGTMGNGVLMFLHSMEWERGCLLSPLIGLLESDLDEVVQLCKTRENGSLKQYQAVTHKVAKMKLQIEVSKMVVNNFIQKKMCNKRALTESAIAKAYVADVVHQNAIMAMEIRGAQSFFHNNLSRNLMLESMGCLFASGTKDIQYDILAKMSGL